MEVIPGEAEVMQSPSSGASVLELGILSPFLPSVLISHDLTQVSGSRAFDSGTMH